MKIKNLTIYLEIINKHILMNYWGYAGNFFTFYKHVLEFSNNILKEAYHSKVYLEDFHNTSSRNPQLQVDHVPEFEEMLEVFLAYLVLDIFLLDHTF